MTGGRVLRLLQDIWSIICHEKNLKGEALLLKIFCYKWILDNKKRTGKLRRKLWNIISRKTEKNPRMTNWVWIQLDLLMAWVSINLIYNEKVGVALFKFTQ